MSTEEEDMQRSLSAEFPPLFITYDKNSQRYSLDNSTRGWVEIGSQSPFTVGYYSEQHIDLSGYARERKTFYPYTGFQQRGGSVTGRIDPVAPAVTLTRQPYAYEINLVSSIPLTETELLNSLTTPPGFQVLSGFTDGTGRINRNTLIYGEIKVYTRDTNIMLSLPGVSQQQYLKLIVNENFSSLEPTNADKLYCYRLFAIGGGADEFLSAFAPPSRILIPGTISKEPKLEYMMRLKRSYELANQV